MTNHTFVVISLIAASILGGCIGFTGCLNGSGHIDSENRSIPGFDGIDLQSSGNLYLDQGAEQPVRIEADDNILPALRTAVQGGVLVIGTDGCIAPTRLNIYVSAPLIRSLAASGSGNIIGRSQISSDSLALNVSGSGGMDLDMSCRNADTSVSGSGSMHLSGQAVNHSAVVSGSGSIRGYDLSTRRSSITISGSGMDEASVSDELDVRISGSGNVYYRGSPGVVQQSISGSGGLHRTG
ncbi:MAG TPA: head GIN domain-containing protein [Methanotrichaceae archaeon]|nr:head GIN domain-containing protein [Methanotrichaceae archaeon]